MRPAKRLDPIGPPRDDLPTGSAFDEGAKAPANLVVVVRDEDAVATAAAMVLSIEST